MTSVDTHWLRPGEMARRLGVTTKALKVYEREGLVAPLRTAAGWRAYGPQQAEHLHLVVALRDLGLPLRDIKGLMDRGHANLADVLVMQREALETQRRQINRALAMLSAVRGKLDIGGDLSVDELTRLTRETAVAQKYGSMQALGSRFDDLVRQRLPGGEGEAAMAAMAAQVGASFGDEAEIARELGILLTEAARLMALGDDASEDAERMVRRWQAVTADIRPPEKPLREEIGKAFEAALNDPVVTPSLTFDPAVLHFVKRVAAGLKARDAEAKAPATGAGAA